MQGFRLSHVSQARDAKNAYASHDKQKVKAMKKLMILAAFLGVLSVATGAEAREYCDPHASHYHHDNRYHDNSRHGKWNKPVKYQPQIVKKVVVYPASCYAIKTDWFGHHSRILRPVCSQNAHLYTKVYYAPQPYGRR